MNYINTTTGSYPVTESQIRAEHPNTSFASPFTPPANYKWVFPVPQPTYNPVTQRVAEDAPSLTNKGTWEQEWEIIDRFPTQAERDEAIAADVEAKRVAAVPQSVTMRQARLALLGAGLLDTVETAIAGVGPAAAIEWEYAQVVERNAGLVPQMATALGMTVRQIDDLFTLAATL